MSTIMSMLDSLVKERKAPPMSWYDAQGSPMRYDNDRQLLDIRTELHDLKLCLGQFSSAVCQQHPENPFAARENYTWSPRYPLSVPREPDRLLRRKYVGGPYGRERRPSPAVFSGVDDVDAPEVPRVSRGVRKPAKVKL